MQPVTFVCATTKDQRLFNKATLLGRSLARIPLQLRPGLAMAFDNVGPAAVGLSELYNRAIDGAPEDMLLVFLHDDLFLHDWYICQRIREGLSAFDVIGLAGSSDGDLKHPSWLLAFDGNLNGLGPQRDIRPSGAVSHFDPYAVEVSFFGPVPQPCQLLDGLFLAARAGTLRSRGVRFDPQFRFHLYDMDFCRTALKAGLRLGTWPIAVTHDSGGNYRSTEWKEAARQYLRKWSSATAPTITGSLTFNAGQS